MLLVSATAGYDDTKTVYALYTLMPKNATLRDIDELLKETWLECCMHLSRFDSGATLVRIRRLRNRHVRLRHPDVRPPRRLGHTPELGGGIRVRHGQHNLPHGQGATGPRTSPSLACPARHRPRQPDPAEPHTRGLRQLPTGSHPLPLGTNPLHRLPPGQPQPVRRTPRQDTATLPRMR